MKTSFSDSHCSSTGRAGAEVINSDGALICTGFPADNTSPCFVPTVHMYSTALRIVPSLGEAAPCELNAFGLYGSPIRQTLRPLRGNGPSSAKRASSEVNRRLEARPAEHRQSERDAQRLRVVSESSLRGADGSRSSLSWSGLARADSGPIRPGLVWRTVLPNPPLPFTDSLQDHEG
ncbi:hypothetical protein EYF80_012931 [Liparis tanakae]|uniref:Uncharacterized protein n=1 Tax=Liparis tanakae TaxID=230148 RepID=A0A4Z2IFZ0_9TELE|nr:hypothetical protein EYF80_012931 [Liparis tanakae]